MRNPFTPRLEYPEYRYHANYYRLKYQLAAQLLHGELTKAENAGSKAGDEPAKPAAPDDASALPSAKVAAREALREVEEIVCELGAPRRGKTLLGGRLTESQKRLLRFLERTVLPCLQIIVAATERGGKGGGTRALEQIRGSVDKPETRELGKRRLFAREDKKETAELEYSYRTIYNLACYVASNTKEQEEALAYLADALRLAPAGRVEELARWAWLDPSLKTLREEKWLEDFEKVVGRGKKPKKAAGSSEDAAAPEKKTDKAAEKDPPPPEKKDHDT